MTMSAIYPVVPSWALGTPVVIDGTAQQVVFAGTPQKGVMIQALSANTGKVYVGPANTVTANNGLELAAGQSLLLPLSSGATVWVLGTGVGDRVHVAVL